jgi:Membrane proteins related to metalloendopeptidases
LSAKGNPVRAALEGKVIYRGNELPAWGNLILIKHKNNWTTAYAHLDKFLVKIGDNVKTGDIIGSVGATGNVKQYQLHFQVRRNSKPLNPIQYLK